MATRVVKELTYDAPLSDVSAMLMDVAFREQVLVHQKVARGTARVEGNVVSIDQFQAARGLPSFATKLVGDEINIQQTETWTATDRADVHLTIPGKPGEMHGTMTLRETDGVTTQTVDLEISVRIPLVGTKIEGLVREILTKALNKEHDAGVAWLAER